MDSLIAQTETQWDSVGKSPDCRLLRLALLRDFTRFLHTLKSEYLSTDRAQLAADLGQLELFLSERFSTLPLASVSFKDLLEQIRRGLPAESALETPRKPTDLHLSPELLSVLDSAKLMRQDRAWERALLEEGSRRHWSVWQFESPIEIHQVEAWTRGFSESIWPRAIVLFIESDGFLHTQDHHPRLAFWRGRWTLLIDPRVTSPEKEFPLQGSVKGSVPVSLPQAPRWKLLFSGKKA